jgi:hypothetical protein
MKLHFQIHGNKSKKKILKKDLKKINKCKFGENGEPSQ